MLLMLLHHTSEEPGDDDEESAERSARPAAVQAGVHGGKLFTRELSLCRPLSELKLPRQLRRVRLDQAPVGHRGWASRRGTERVGRDYVPRIMLLTEAPPRRRALGVERIIDRICANSC